MLFSVGKDNENQSEEQINKEKSFRVSDIFRNFAAVNQKIK